ncbi:putative galactinol--sucrose galactosyltransferase [Lachnellula willkommii]|uniref:Putative galactinol--sucrose galactosyltransferase n=1 Tax=Lachnellula willkommii TaxID=215461 RepID=A0A559MAL6_9HELO|nr:putative galactinol--sucrose galactosyltransferase [Lachnellula willkommii]
MTLKLLDSNYVGPDNMPDNSHIWANSKSNKSPKISSAPILTKYQAIITVVLVSNQPGILWEVAIWHNSSESGSWSQTDLQNTGEQVQTLGQDSRKDKVGMLYTGSLNRPSSKSHVVHFTIKYRTAGQEWNWVNDQSGSGDAELVFSQNVTIPESISHYLQNSDQSLSLETYDTTLSGGPRSEERAWSISYSIPAAIERSAFVNIDLGLPLNTLRWFCLARESRPWLCPRQGRGNFSPEEDAVLVSFLRRDGLHFVLLAVSVDDNLTVIKPGKDGTLIAVSRNEAPAPRTAYIIAATGRTFERANEAAIYHAKSIVTEKTKDTRLEIESLASTILPKCLEEWYDSFAYCTWNGLGQNLTDEKIYDALDVMSNAGIFFSTIIIDDNWQSIDRYGSNNFHHRWIEFEADRKAFPRGLKHTVSMIRERNPSVKHIAVWHGIMGYWNGIAPDGHVAKCYKTQTMKKQDNGFFGGGSLVAIDASDVHRFYEDFYQFLADCGIDSVKTDTQFILDQLEDAPDRAHCISTYQDAWATAALRHFSAKAISCMSQTPQILFHSQLLVSLPKLMVRNSEDFFPSEPASHPWHIFCNAHTNVFTQHLNVLPDWDMFQTSHEYSAFHGAARCISGGPIYLTDKPGEHDINLIKQMTARSMHETIILRPKVAKTTYVYASNKEKRLLRIGTSTIDTGVPMLGIFNINDQPLAEIFTLEDFIDVSPTERYIIRAHTSSKISTPLRLPGSKTRHLLGLDVKGYEILTAYPLQTILHPIKKAAVDISVLGLLDKMTGAAAVRYSTIRVDGNGVVLRVVLKAMGQLGL